MKKRKFGAIVSKEHNRTLEASPLMLPPAILPLPPLSFVPAVILPEAPKLTPPLSLQAAPLPASSPISPPGISLFNSTLKRVTSFVENLAQLSLSSDVEGRHANLNAGVACQEGDLEEVIKRQRTLSSPRSKG